MAETRTPSGGGIPLGDSFIPLEEAWKNYIPDGGEQIRVVDICDVCLRIRSFYTELDWRCTAHDHASCLVRFYQARQRLD